MWLNLTDLFETGAASEEAQVDRIDMRQIKFALVVLHVFGFFWFREQSGRVGSRQNRCQGNRHHQQHQLRPGCRHLWVFSSTTHDGRRKLDLDFLSHRLLFFSGNFQ